jgi:hypothetical protein
MEAFSEWHQIGMGFCIRTVQALGVCGSVGSVAMNLAHENSIVVFNFSCDAEL